MTSLVWTMTILGEASPPITKLLVKPRQFLQGMLFSPLPEHVAAKTRNISAERVVQAIAEMSSAVGSQGLVAGQIVDLASEGKYVSLSDLEYIHVHKSAKLLEAAVVCGAIIGGRDVIEIEKVRKYVRCIGLLFQVVDDILDITKSSKELGKTAGKDLVSDKSTYPKLMGIENAKKFAGELSSQAIQELAYFEVEKDNLDPALLEFAWVELVEKNKTSVSA
ncbi:hypothetical protein Q3G72_026344 [Acer saccharum]|nr:hypothetical protein Q3G72_026344 [Acer saccharum]